MCFVNPALAQSDGSCGSNGTFDNLEVIGLTGNQRLICFAEDTPRRQQDLGRIVGLVGDEVLVGIDFRPANGVLYGLGNQAGIYTIDPATATAMFRARLVNMATMMPVPLMGTSFGVDFNPVPDRLRVVSDAGQNLRINVDNGVTAVDLTLSGLGVTGVAYTNNDNDVNTATTLYDIDTLNDQLSIQAPPNNGTLTPVGRLTLNNALQDVALTTGFDIFSQLRRVTRTPLVNTTQDVKALATLTVGTTTLIVIVNLDTGALVSRGSFRPGDQILDIAIPLVQGTN
jgi:hypothetical protein